jgi:hypothetical protein
VAARLSVVQGEGGGKDGTGRRAVLALRTLALVRVGELEASGAPELQAVRRSALLVPQPQKHCLRRLRGANFGPLNCARIMIEKHAEKPKNNQTTCIFAVPRTKKTAIGLGMRNQGAVFTIGANRIDAIGKVENRLGGVR